jgi:hypothetical protein
LKIPGQCGINKGVRLLKTIVTVLLAAAWLPLAAHCQIETATGLEFLVCQPDAAPGQGGSSHCNDALCCDWESVLYHSPQNQPQVMPHLVGMVPPASLARLGNDLPAEVPARPPAAAPPDLPKPWQFVLRAALPVRAPSVAS